jgi:hypothetical protein
MYKWTKEIRAGALDGTIPCQDTSRKYYTNMSWNVTVKLGKIILGSGIRHDKAHTSAHNASVASHVVTSVVEIERNQ